MSAGCPTRQDLPSVAFENWRQHLVTQRGDPDLVLVAAAGNNSSPWGFWPAVLRLGHGRRVARPGRPGVELLQLGRLGRRVRPGPEPGQRLPNGTYVCHEAPDRGDSRIFDNGLARWSGTSFSAPLVTGLIAAEMSQRQVQPGQQRSARTARDTVLSVGPNRPALSARTAPVVADGLLIPVPV